MSRHRLHPRRGGRHGGAALEFALVGPAFLLMIAGMISWGGYFWMSHALQQIANDAARAAVGGLDSAERSGLAKGVLADEIGTYSILTAASAQISVADSPTELTVQVAYDASASPFWVMKGLVPLPSPALSRAASVRLGGY